MLARGHRHRAGTAIAIAHTDRGPSRRASGTGHFSGRLSFFVHPRSENRDAAGRIAGSRDFRRRPGGQSPRAPDATPLPDQFPPAAPHAPRRHDVVTSNDGPPSGTRIRSTPVAQPVAPALRRRPRSASTRSGNPPKKRRPNRTSTRKIHVTGHLTARALPQQRATTPRPGRRQRKGRNGRRRGKTTARGGCAHRCEGGRRTTQVRRWASRWGLTRARMSSIWSSRALRAGM